MGLVVGVWIISNAYTRFFWQILSLLDNNFRKLKCIRTECRDPFLFLPKICIIFISESPHFLKASCYGINLDFAVSSSIMSFLFHLSCFLNFYPSIFGFFLLLFFDCLFIASFSFIALIFILYYLIAFILYDISFIYYH